MTKKMGLAWLILSCSACQGCKSGGGQPLPVPGVAMGSLTVTSRSFPSGGTIPVDSTCDGADNSPQLTWSAPPPGTRAFAIIAEDPDAPGGHFTHWIAYNLPGELRDLSESADLSTLGGAVATNDFNRLGYSGPCPPRGELHRYYFHVFALNAPLAVTADAARGAVDVALSGHVLARGTLVATSSR